MKDNLEKAFKTSLEEYEVPYDPKAWDAVNAQLGSNAAAGGSLLSNALKWVLASVLLGAVVAGSYFLWFNEENARTVQTADVENEKQVETPTNKKRNKSNEEILVTTDSADVEPEKPTGTDNRITPIIKDKENSTENKKVKKEEKETNAKGTSTPKAKEVTPIIPKKEVDNSNQFVSGHISTPIVCLGEAIEISNLSKNEIVRFQINEEWIVLQPNKTYLLAPKESAVVNFVNDKNELIEAKYVKVHDLPAPDFNFEANVYEDGLPVVIAEAYGDYPSYTWIFDEETKREGAEVRHNFYDKGEYNITLNVIDRNGCRATTTKTVRIRDKYNLMAVDAFKPNGSDVRNRAFMPYSLTERDVRFQLTIVDPIDNGVVFTSSDAADAWDGTDQRTGKMTPSNKAFIWKVQIFNPTPNERPIYAGTIVHN